MTDEERVIVAVRRAFAQEEFVVGNFAIRVLAAIRAAAESAYDSGMTFESTKGEAWPHALDAALAALTDHPGGTDK